LQNFGGSYALKVSRGGEAGAWVTGELGVEPTREAAWGEWLGGRGGGGGGSRGERGGRELAITTPTPTTQHKQTQPA